MAKYGFYLIKFLAVAESGRKLFDLQASLKIIEGLEFENFTDLINNFENQIFPPEYPLENLKVKTALFWGAKDELADPKDVEFIRKKIQNNLIGDFEYEDYTHVDFIWGMSAPNRVYNLIMDLMKQY